MSENSSDAKNLPVQAAVTFPDALPLMMLRDQVVFPLALVPLRAGGKEEIQLVDDAVKAAGLLAIVAQRSPEADSPIPQRRLRDRVYRPYPPGAARP